MGGSTERQSGFLCDFIKLREKGKIVEEEVCQSVSECLIRKFIWGQRGVRTQESECQLEVEVLMDYRSLWAQAVLKLSYQKYSR